MKPETQKLWMSTAVAAAFCQPALLRSRRTSNDKSVLRHIVAAAEYVIELQMQSTDVAHVFRHLASWLEETGSHRRSVDLLLYVIGFLPNLDEESRKLEPSIRHQLACVYTTLGEFAEAELQLRQGLVITGDPRRHLQPAHHWLSVSLGDLLSTTGRLGEAKRIVAKGILSLKREHRHGSDYAAYLRSMARLYTLDGNYRRAEVCLLQSLRKGDQGKTDSLLGNAEGFWQLAELYSMEYRLVEAEKCLEESEVAWRSSNSEDMSFLAKCHTTLSQIYFRQNRLEESRASLLNAVRVRRDLFGIDHPSIALNLGDLGLLNIRLDRFTEARTSLEEALRIAAIAFGVRHFEYLKILNAQAMLFRVRGKYSEAEREYNAVLEVAHEIFKPPHPLVAATLANLGIVYLATGDHALAEAALNESIEVSKALSGGTVVMEAIPSLISLAGLFVSTSRYEEASAICEKELPSVLACVGRTHPFYVSLLCILGRARWELGFVMEAENTYREAIQIAERSSSGLSAEYASAAADLGLMLLVETERKVEARTLIKLAEKIFVESYDEGHPILQRIRSYSELCDK